MDNFKMQLNSEKNRITVKYSGQVHYRTLLKILEELLDISMMERVHVILDFSEVQTMLLGYRQIINFRLGLSTLLPKKTVSKIAVINPPKTSLINTICSSVPLIENDIAKHDLRCFGIDRKVEAYQWLS